MTRLLSALAILAACAPILLAQDKPVPPGEAAGKMTLPEGFHATLFAGEPAVVQPIAFTFDDRGRLWVVECNSYPKWTTNKEGKDRVLIFEDKDGDGHFDKCTVFYDKGANLTGIEVVAHGTTNPWGLDFDDFGQMFITNCVIKHIWHVVPGAHFQRMFGQDINPYSYGLLESGADHIHWAGGDWTTSRGGQGAHSDAGGGHAHVGCLVYLGDNFPAEYRNSVFMCNLHGNRLNRDTLERKGSTYVAHHGPDFLFANDSWFRGLCLKSGPDGALYVSDWTDTGECHNY